MSNADRDKPHEKSMGKKGFKVSKLLEALNLFPYKPDNKRDKKSK